MLHVWHTIPLSLTVTYYNTFSWILPFRQGLKFTVKNDVTLTRCFFCYSALLHCFTTECIRKLYKENGKKRCLELIFSWLNGLWVRTNTPFINIWFDLISPEKPNDSLVSHVMGLRYRVLYNEWTVHVISRQMSVWGWIYRKECHIGVASY